MESVRFLILLLVLTLTGCSAFSNAAPTPLPTVVLGDASTTPQPAASGGSIASGGVTASGIVAPAQEAQMSSTSGGSIKTVKVAVGDKVQAGQVLVQLAGAEKLAAALEAANLDLLVSQQALKTLNDQANQARTAAQLRLANAQRTLDDAQKRRTWKQYRNGSQSAIDSAQADLILANDTLKKAEDTYGGVANYADNDINRAAALSALSAARKAHDRALANLNFLLAMPDAIAVNQAEAELQAAQAEVENAQQEFDRLKNGPDPDALALAEERIKNATAQIQASQAALADLELKAPFDGTISQVNVHSGGWVVAGQTILALADLDNLRIETTDLSERDIPRVQVGQPVRFLVKALGQERTGRVREISPLAGTLGGDVVYKTTIDLDAPLPGLRAGMSVDVQFGSSQ